MPSVLPGAMRRLITLKGLVHEVARWASLGGSEGIDMTFVCGERWVKPHAFVDGVYWITTRNETDSATCLWCVAGRERI